MLEILRDHGVTATLFVTSNYAENEGMMDLLKRAQAEGHELGNHMPEDREYHLDSEQKFREELLRTKAITGDCPWFRPPWARLSPQMMKVLSEFQYKIALGDIFSHDTRVVNSAKYHADYIKKFTKDGSIIVLHCPDKKF